MGGDRHNMGCVTARCGQTSSSLASQVATPSPEHFLRISAFVPTSYPHKCSLLARSPARLREAAEAEARRVAEAEAAIARRRAAAQAALLPEPASGSPGSAAIRLRLPDGTNTSRSFPEGATLQVGRRLVVIKQASP